MRARTLRFYSWILASVIVNLQSPAAFAAVPQSTAKHDRAFWHSIQNNHYAVPEGESAVALAHEVSGYSARPISNCATILRILFSTVWIVRRPQLSREEAHPISRRVDR